MVVWIGSPGSKRIVQGMSLRRGGAFLEGGMAHNKPGELTLLSLEPEKSGGAGDRVLGVALAWAMLSSARGKGPAKAQHGISAQYPRVQPKDVLPTIPPPLAPGWWRVHWVGKQVAGGTPGLDSSTFCCVPGPRHASFQLQPSHSQVPVWGHSATFWLFPKA